MVKEPQDPREAERLYKAMNCFLNQQETQGMVEWMQVELSRLDSVNRYEMSDDEFKRRQGACQVIEELLAMAKMARSKVDKLEKRKGGG